MTEEPTENRFDRTLAWLPAAAAALGAALLPLARGGWDLWAKSYAAAAVAALLGIWAAALALRGRLPRLRAETSAVPVICMALCWLSLQTSAIRWLCLPEFTAFLLAASPFLFFPFTGRKEAAIQTLFGAALFLSLLAIYQKLFLHTAATASFFNENVFAGFAVTVLPLLAGRKRYAETAILAVALLCTGSRGAWLALALSGGLCLILAEGKKKTAGIALLAATVICALLFNWHSLSDRAAWWTEAARMAAQKPWLGFGPGSFEFVYPSMHSPRADGLSAIYAHSYPLECAAACGLAFATIWTLWLFFRALKAGGFIRWAALAALLLSLEDYTLNVPSNLFLLCLLLSSRDKGAFIEIRNSALRVLASACLLGGGLALAQSSLAMLKAEKEVLAAKTLYESGKRTEGLAAAGKALANHPYSYQAALLRASMLMDSSGGTASPELAKAYERLLDLNPYRPQTYVSLGKIYSALGQPPLAGNVEERRRHFIKWR